jgi:phosphoribosylformylglycinamidine (FGAM) synthase-like amidotransferase family enzyme
VAKATTLVNKMSKVKVLVVRAPGTNRDGEAVYAFELAGAEVTLAHVNQLIRRECNLFDYQIFVIPGGFSYGDDIASGKVLANQLQMKFGKDMLKFVDDGRLVFGICNGFQVLVKSGILPRVKKGVPLGISECESEESLHFYERDGKHVRPCGAWGR